LKVRPPTSGNAALRVTLLAESKFICMMTRYPAQHFLPDADQEISDQYSVPVQ
jgi:hypothetical protein